MLPPGTGAPVQQTPLPTEQVALPGQAPAGGAVGDIQIPTESGDVLQLHEPKKYVGDGVDQRELHRLTPEEKASRRFRKNLILAVVGGLVLIATAFALM